MDIVLIDDNGTKWTRSQMKARLDKINDRLRRKHGNRYRVILRWSAYWQRPMYYLQTRTWLFFWRLVRYLDHYPNCCQVLEATHAFNPHYFDQHVIPQMESNRKFRAVKVG